MGCVLTGICESTAAQVGIQVGGAAVFAKYSRDDERQADEDAVGLVMRAHVSPLGIVDILQKLLDERRSKPGGVSAWFRTHPYEEDRNARTAPCPTPLSDLSITGKSSACRPGTDTNRSLSAAIIGATAQQDDLVRPTGQHGDRGQLRGRMRTFVMTSGSEFRPLPPPAGHQSVSLPPDTRAR